MKRPTIWQAPLLAAALLLGGSLPARSADHGDSPVVAGDQAADLADLYFFLDPNDNTKAVLVGTFRGFIVPGEAVNFGVFDPSVKYRFRIENTGDASPDQIYTVSFTRRASTSAAQTAVIRMPDGTTKTALATNPSLSSTSSPAPVVTGIGGGVQFFAGEVDDPFFFDIPAFSRFVGSVLGGSPDPTQLNRGRDTFAGYNITAIALRIPVAKLRGPGTVIGADFAAFRGSQSVLSTGEIASTPPFRQIDRIGNPGVNVALVPFDQKRLYNVSSTVDDANGVFAGGIVGTLNALGTNPTNIGTLASVAVTNGDFLHLDTTVANSGPGGGSNAGAGFPNGRRLGDDVIDTLLFLVTNGVITTGDHVDGNDVPRRDVFPFLAASQQPRAAGRDDNTRN